MAAAERRRLFLFYIAALLVIWQGALGIAAAQVERDQSDLRVTAVDLGSFPVVHVRVLTTDAGSEPIDDLSRLVLREDGVPISDVTLAQVPAGIDLAVVLDANPDFLQFDDRSGLNRRDKVAAGLTRFAEQHMNPAGLDRVSVIVPDETGEGAAFLLQDATRPDGLTAALDAYAPTPPRVTPLNTMLAEAIAHLAAQRDDGRFQAVLLLTDGARLDRQLDYPALVEAAQAAGVPIFAGILGAEASPEEIANVARLYEPTNGQFLHLPDPEAADPFYRLFERHGTQTEIQYRSLLREGGPHEVSVSLGNQGDTAAFELNLAPPVVSLDGAAGVVRRAGSAPDTPLPLLQPAVQPLTATITWPDGRARRLESLTFLVNDRPVPLPSGVPADAAGHVPLVWDISDLDDGVYELSVAVTDELGFEARSEPVTVAIEVARPTAPTPTPVPTRPPIVTLPAVDGRRVVVVGGVAAAGLLLAALALVLLARRRRRPAPAPAASAAAGPPPPKPPDRHVPVLQWVDSGERVTLPGDYVTIGRDPEVATLVFDDPSLSRLHARVRRAEDAYWLYDEGSAAGTFLNYERLGLAPRELHHGDIVQFGRLTLRFALELRPRGDGDGPAATQESE